MTTDPLLVILMLAVAIGALFLAIPILWFIFVFASSTRLHRRRRAAWRNVLPDPEPQAIRHNWPGRTEATPYNVRHLRPRP